VRFELPQRSPMALARGVFGPLKQANLQACAGLCGGVGRPDGNFPIQGHLAVGARNTPKRGRGSRPAGMAGDKMGRACQDRSEALLNSSEALKVHDVALANGAWCGDGKVVVVTFGRRRTSWMRSTTNLRPRGCHCRAQLRRLPSEGTGCRAFKAGRSHHSSEFEKSRRRSALQRFLFPGALSALGGQMTLEAAGGWRDLLNA